MAATKTKPKKKKPKALAPESAPPPPGTHGPTVLSVGPRPAGVRVTEDTALTLGAVFACVRVISEDLAKLPWGVFKRLPSGGRQAQPTHDMEWLLDFQSNPETPAFQWRETIVAHALTWGNGYSEIERDLAGRPVWLWQLTPDRVTPERASPQLLQVYADLKREGVRPGEVVYRVANPTGPPTYLPAADMFHLRGPAFDGLVGYSVIRLAARAIGLGIALEEEAAGFSSNDSTPGGVLQHPGRLSPEASNNLRASWQRVHGGPRNRRTVAVLEEGMTWAQTGLPPGDSQFVEQRQITPSEICRWFRVPPHKIADLLRATFSNIEEQNIQYHNDALQPWAARLEAEANIKLFGQVQRGSFITRHDFKSLLRGNTAAQGAFVKEMTGCGVFNVDDARDYLDLNPVGPGDGGDKRLVPMNMVPLDKIGEEPPAPKPPPFGQHPPPMPGGNGKAPESPPAKQSPPPEKMRAALLPVLADGCRRLAKREEHPFKTDGERRAYALAVLSPPALSLALLAGGTSRAAAVAVGVFLDNRPTDPAAWAEDLCARVLVAAAAEVPGRPFAEALYDPDQPRDDHGRFGAGGSGARGGETGAVARAVLSVVRSRQSAEVLAVTNGLGGGQGGAAGLDFNPDQPRVPAGQPGGGQFGSGGGDGAKGDKSKGVTLGGGSARLRGRTVEEAAAAAKEASKDFVTKAVEAAKAKLSGAAKAIYDKMPAAVQKAVDVGVKVEHGAEQFYKEGQALAREVARGAGLSDQHAERVGRVLALGDTVSRWGINWQVAHAALEPIGGPVVAFAGAKASYYFPSASFAYVGYQMAKAAVTGKDPVALVKAARERVKAAAPAKAHLRNWKERLAMYEGPTAEARKAFAEGVTRWLAGLPAERLEWAEALLAAALDETGDLEDALAAAKKAYAAGDPPE